MTLGDACKAGKCASGAKLLTCAVDSDCDKFDDGDLCNGVLFCDKSDKTCKVNPQTAISCPSGGDTACTVNTCDKQTGACNFVAQKNGTVCDDGDQCTAGDLCLLGDCTAGAKFTCPCKADSDCASHDNGDVCDGVFFCNKATNACQYDPNSLVVCKTVDDTACAKNACAPKTGECGLVAAATTKTVCDVGTNKTCRTVVKAAGEATATNVACDDGDACTGNDLCDGKVCKGLTKTCFCATNADCLKEDDGDVCNGVPYCDKSGAQPQCVQNAASSVKCPKHLDGPCLHNVCKKHNGVCVLEPFNDTQACDDGAPCTAKTTCDGGSCGGGAATKCNDNNACTVDTCKVGVGCVFTAKVCHDGNACTANACAPATGICIADNKSKQGASCDGDNNGCTVNDVCDAGVCKTGPMVICKATAGPCEAVTCSSLSGTDHKCVAAAKEDGAGCDDGDPCVLGATCKAGVCAKGDKPRLFAQAYTTWSKVNLTAVQSVVAGTLYGGTYERTFKDGSKAREWLLRVTDDTGFGFRLIALPSATPGGAGAVVGAAEIGETTHAIAGTDTMKTKDVRVVAYGGGVGKGKVVWDLRIDGGGDEEATSMIDHPAGGMIVSNTAAANKTAATAAQVHRVSNTGTLLWTWKSAVNGPVTLAGLAAAAADGSVTAVGATQAETPGVERGWVVKLDAAGKLLWTRAHGGELKQRLAAVAILPDGVMVAVGESGPVSDPRWWMARLDATGNLLSSKIATVRSTMTAAVAHHGGLVAMAGTSWPTGSTTDGLLLGTDTFGNTVWDRAIDLGETDRLTALDVDDLGRVLAAGATGDTGLLVRADAWGQIKCEASGGCANKQVSKCDDNNGCTVDRCNAKNGCTNSAVVGTRCSDGDGCTLGGACVHKKGCVPSVEGRLHERVVDVAGLASVASSVPVTGGGLLTFGLSADGKVLAFETDRYAAKTSKARILGDGATSVAGGLQTSGGGTMVVYTTTDQRVLARGHDGSGKQIWEKQLAHGAIKAGCKCNAGYCTGDTRHVPDKVRAIRLAPATKPGSVLIVIEEQMTQVCYGNKIAGSSPYTRPFIGCARVVELQATSGSFKQRYKACRGSWKLVSYNTGNPNKIVSDVHPHVPTAAVAVSDGSVVVASRRRLAKLVGACGAPKYDCTYQPTGATDAVVSRVGTDGKPLWSQVFFAGSKTNSIDALAATGNGGFVGVGTASDDNDTSRLWITQIGASGAKLWQRFLPTDVGAFNVQQLQVVTGNDLLVAGSITDGGANKAWISRRSREGLELWSKAYAYKGTSTGIGSAPLLRKPDGSLSLTATATVEGTTQALFIRADPWGASSCAESGTCASKTEASCSDGKADTIDLCSPKSSAGQPAGCQHKPAVCKPRAACEVATTDVKLSCLYAPDKCDDSNACTTDSCDPKKGTSTGGGCVHTPIDVAKACDDGKICTLETCDKAEGCKSDNAPDGLTCKPGPCHDGTCKSGICDAKLVETRLGCSKLSKASSCKAIKFADPDRPDGVYWLDTDGFGASDIGHRGVCDMTNNGGGWTLLLKSDGDCTFHHDSKFWSQFDLLSNTDTTTKVGNAKFSSYNNLKLQEMRFVWPTLDNMTAVQPLPKAPITARSMFSIKTPSVLQPLKGTYHSSWPPHGQTNQYGFNLTSCSDDIRARWGWVIKHGKYCDVHNESSMGVGMNCKYGLSAGWATNSAVGNANKGAAQPVLIWGR